MKAGMIIPQGWTGEFDDWDSTRAWERSVSLARQAERLGFESIWMFDHFHTAPRQTDQITFESFTALTALAMATRRVRLGHIVICAGFRNPALMAKMICTMDVISGGRMELGIGAGWKEDEWRAYGYGYPGTRDRLGAFRDSLEILTRMMAQGAGTRATYDGHYSMVAEATNVPKPVQRPRVPIMVGGNGPEVTWRLAAAFADELNLDGLDPDQTAAAMPVIASRCEEIGRDPASLRVSVHQMWGNAQPSGPEVRPAASGSERVDRLSRYSEIGVWRVMELLRASVDADEAMGTYAEDCVKAGVVLEPDR